MANDKAVQPIPIPPQRRKCPQCGRENSLATWDVMNGKCSDCLDFRFRDDNKSSAPPVQPIPEASASKSVPVHYDYSTPEAAALTNMRLRAESAESALAAERQAHEILRRVNDSILTEQIVTNGQLRAELEKLKGAVSDSGHMGINVSNLKAICFKLDQGYNNGDLDCKTLNSFLKSIVAALESLRGDI